MRKIHWLIFFYSSSLLATDANWVAVGNANWNAGASWSTNPTFPNAANDLAHFLNSATASSRTVTLGQNITIGSLTFLNTQSRSYIIAGGSTTSLTFSATGSAVLQIQSGNTAAHSINNTVTSVGLSSPLNLTNDSTTLFTIAAPISRGTNDLSIALSNTGGVTLSGTTLSGNGNLISSIASTGNVTVSGAISGSGAVTKNGTGGGALILSSATNSYGGATTINQGNLTYNANGAIPAGSAVTVGNGTDSANLTIAVAMTAPFTNPLTLNASGTLAQNANTFLSSLQGSGAVAMTTTGTNLFDITGSANSTYSGAISGGAISASTNNTTGNRLNKGGTSTLTLSSAASSYVSRTFIASGIIDVQNGSALGAAGSSSAVYVQAVTNQGSLYLESNIVLPKTVFLNGSGFSSAGALRNLSGANEVSGTVTIGWTGGTETAASSATLQVDGTSLKLSGALAGNTAGVNLTKTGSGTLIYSGSIANTFNQLTSVNGGTLQLNKTAGTNAIAGAVTINSGGTLQLLAADQIINTANLGIITVNSGGTFDMNGNADTLAALVLNSGGTFTQGGATLSLTNTSASAVTALTMGDGASISGNVAFTSTGGLLYNGTTSMASFSGTLDLINTAHVFNINDGAATVDLDISGVITGSATAGTITKSTGTGTLQFSGSSPNTYLGTTTVSAGTLLLNKSADTIAIPAAVTINSGGTVKLAANNQIADSSTMTINSGGTFDMGAFNESFTRLIINGGGIFTSSASTPPLILTASGGANALTIGSSVVFSKNLVLTASSGNGGGITYNGTSAATISGNIDLDARVHIFSTVNTPAGVTDLLISGLISGSGASVTVSGAGLLEFTNTNTYTGTTLISTGNLLLNNSSGNAIAGDVQFLAGESTGSLNLGQSNQIADTATLTLNAATFNMNGHSETIQTFIYQSGAFNQAGGLLTVNNASPGNALVMRNVTISGPLAISGGGIVAYQSTDGGTATISGTLDLGTVTSSFNIDDGPLATDMAISAPIASSGAGLTKIGAGLLSLSGASSNTYSGLTTITAGELSLAKTAGLNAIPGDVLINGGTLSLAAANQIADTTMTISSGTFNMAGFAETIAALNYNGGSLIQGGATLTLDSGSTALSLQNVTLPSSGGLGTVAITNGGAVAFIGASGTATINSALDLGASTIVFTINDGSSAVDMSITGAIANGGLTKQGAGTLTLSGANSYTGGTNISAGTLAMVGSGTLATTGNLTLSGSGNFTISGGVSQTVADLSGTSSTTIVLGANNLTEGTAGSTAFSGVISGAGGSLTKQNGGTLTLSGINSYTGGTTITGGSIAMSGTGIIVGNLTLSGAGNFDISGGASQVLDDLNGSGSTTINLGGNNLTAGAGNSDNFAGVISGAGGTFTKMGSGTLTLSGTASNTYSGLTTITAGELSLAKTAGLDAIPGDVLINGGTLFLAAANQIADTSAMTISSGSFDLGGNVETILSLSGSGGPVTNSNAAASTLTLSFASGPNTTYSGNLVDGAGSIALVKQGSPTFTLTGNNTYSGSTTLSGGTLQAGSTTGFSLNSPFTIGSSGTLDLANNSSTILSLAGSAGASVTSSAAGAATLTFSYASGPNTTYSGNIVDGAGSIALLKQGSPTLTLAGNNTYSGATTIDAGSLQAGSITAFSPNSPFAVTGTLDLANFNNTIASLSGAGSVLLGSAILTLGGDNTSTTFSGAIGGTGGITKTGSGIFTLSSTSSYTGATTINAGTLVVNGTIDSSIGGVDVNAGGILKGIGQIQGNVSVLGTIVPGNSIGTLFINNNLTLVSGSTTQVEINASGAASLLEVSGTAAIGGTLVVLPQVPGMYAAGTTWHIIHAAGGVNSTTHFTYTPPPQIPTLLVDYSNPNFVNLFLPEPTPIGIQTEGLSGNNLILANYLNSLLADPAIFNVIDNLFLLTDGALNDALTSISPLRLTSEVFASLNIQFAFTELLFSHLRQIRMVKKFGVERYPKALAQEKLVADARSFIAAAEKRKTSSKAAQKQDNYCFWATGFGQVVHETGRDTNPSFDVSTGAALAGMEFFTGPSSTVGATFGYAHNWLKQDFNLGSATSNLYLSSLYFSYYEELFYLDTALWGSYNRTHNQRNVVIPGTDAVGTSNSHSWTLTPHIDFGVDLTYNFLTIEPFAAFDWPINWQGKIVENNNFALAMNANAYTSSMLRSEVGLTFYESQKCPWGIFYVRETIGYVNKKPFSVGKITSAIVGQPGSFTLETFTNTQNIIAPEFELFWKLNNGAFFSLIYEGEFGNGYRSNEVLGEIGVYF